jgi:hypothetical protein
MVRNRAVSGFRSEDYLQCVDRLLDIEDLSWQTSLASSAVSAAEDVRSAVRVARTASNARAATSSAACTAQAACERGEFLNLDEARAAQTRASIAQSHAIHAAVVEHEAKTVKRRATLALAHDVKIWNVHRKREMLRSCIAYARSQHEATRRSVDAWSTLRDGFIGTTVCPSVVERKPALQVQPMQSPRRHPPETRPLVEPGEVTAVIYEDNASFIDFEYPRSIVAIDHHTLSTSHATPEDASELPPTSDSTAVARNEPCKSEEASESDPTFPFAEAAPVHQDEVADLMQFSSIDESNAGGSNTQSESTTRESAVTDEKLSASMQSLVDGLMNWGGGFEAEEDHFALPAGMAASIAMEESNSFGTSSPFRIA